MHSVEPSLVRTGGGRNSPGGRGHELKYSNAGRRKTLGKAGIVAAAWEREVGHLQQRLGRPLGPGFIRPKAH